VVIVIISLLAGMALGALAKAREAGKLEATKATIAKLNDLVTKRYETYRTRRIPINLSGISDLNYVAFWRMIGIRYLMLTEMPQCWTDITNPPPITVPIAGGSEQLARPSLSQIYLAKYNANMPPATSDHQQAKCLYLWVTTAMPESKALFRGEEIGVDPDGWKYFADGWGHPIGFLRWAPGATSGPKNPSGWSDIQIDDTPSAQFPNLTNQHHDPFDPRLLENGPNSFAYNNTTYRYKFPNGAYQLYPLIFAGVLGKVTFNGMTFDDYGIVLGNGATTGDPRDIKVLPPVPSQIDPYNTPYYAGMLATGSGTASIGGVMQASGGQPAGGVPLVTNHHIEAK
jgi:hypothetical protein